MDGFREIIEQRHDYAKKWKTETGGRVLGYFCTYVPEEIVYAAGILPVRIIGSHQSITRTERHIANMFCAFCRDCLAQGLEGKYSYLDGIVKARSCQHMRQAFTSWQTHIPVKYSYYISMPALVQSPAAKPYLVNELLNFKRSLEDWTGYPISDQALRQAIEVYNSNRRLLRQVYDLRKAADPPLSGAESLEITLSNQLADKMYLNRLLSESLAKLSQKNEKRDTGARLMLIGSENDDIDYIKFMESLGSTVVIDESCTGSRYFWNECRLDSDPLDALATRYLERPPCPAKDLPQRRRSAHILQLIQDYNVDGVIITIQKFCQNHELDLPALQSLFQAKGIPVLILEYAFGSPLEWLRIRIQAFLEMIRSQSIWA
jgi:benzoyl-CoA reductase subunit C